MPKTETKKKAVKKEPKKVVKPAVKKPVEKKVAAKPEVKKPVEKKVAAKPAVKKPASAKGGSASGGKPEAVVVEVEKTLPAAAELSSAAAELSLAAAPEAGTVVSPGSFIRTRGRRKTAIARVRLVTSGKGVFVVNGKPMEQYFTTFEQRLLANQPLKTVGMETAMDVSAQVSGGGMHGQAESVRLGIARALVALNPAYRKTLKKLGFLTRDPRAKERKKPGLKRARRAPQWSKR